MKHRLFVALGLIIAFLALGFLYIRETPHYSFYMLVLAIQRHDPDEAMKYIDIDNIADNLSTLLLGGTAADGTDKNGKKPSSLKTIIGKALPGMKESIRSSLHDAIASHNDDHRGSDSHAIEISNLDLKKIQQTSFRDLSVQRNKKTAFIRLKNLPGLKARMVKTRSGHWQIVEILPEAG